MKGNQFTTSAVLWILLSLATCAFGAEVAVVEGTTTATDITQAYKRDTNTARAKFQDKKVTITGQLDSITTVTGGDSVNLEDSVNARVKQKAAELDEIRAAQKDELARMGKALEWASKYEHDRKSRLVNSNRDNRDGVDSRLYDEYKESMNPNGPRHNNLIIEVTLTGICKGVRSGKVYIDDCKEISFTTRKGNPQADVRKK